MTFTPYYSDWKDFPDTSTPITAAALENFDAGITAARTAAGLGEYPTTAYCVSKQGSDSNSGHSWDDAFLTISKAMTVAGIGTNVFVGPGTFTETVTMARCNLIGYGPDNATGGTTVKAPSDGADCIVVSNKVGANITAIQTLGTGANWTGRGIYQSGSGYSRIYRWKHFNGEVTPTAENSCGVGLYLTGNNEHLSLDHCTISQCGVGLYGYSAASSMVTNCTFSQCWKDIHLENLGGGFTFEDCKGVSPINRNSAEDVVYIGTSQNVFISCDFSEGQNLATFRVANQHDGTGGHAGNLFVGGAIPASCTAVIEGPKNRFLNFSFARGLTVSGNHNKFDGCVQYGSTELTLSGSYNEFVDWRGGGTNGAMPIISGSYNVLRRPVVTGSGTIAVGGTNNLVEMPEETGSPSYTTGSGTVVRKTPL